jgi:predicted enzyme related to lactoylglutathione lyase
MKHGQFLWYDVMTSDTAAAGDFYSQVVGWSLQPAAAPGMDYTVFQIEGDRGVAGLMPIPDDMKDQARPCWLTYIAVDDVEAAAAKIQSLGGALHKGPVTVPGIITFAVVADPQGAGFLIAKGLSAEAMPALPMNTPGAAGWFELYATDWEKVFPFYEAMFGWTKAEAVDMGPMGQYQLFAAGAEPVGGMMTKPPQIPMPMWGLYLNVAGIDAPVAKVKALGGTVMMEPHQVPGGNWAAQCMDPQGAAFGLTALRR